MTSGLCKVNWCHVWYDHNFSLRANHQSRHHATCKIDVNLVMTDGHFNLPQGVYVGMYGLRYSLNPHPQKRYVHITQKPVYALYMDSFYYADPNNSRGWNNSSGWKKS